MLVYPTLFAQGQVHFKSGMTHAHKAYLEFEKSPCFTASITLVFTIPISSHKNIFELPHYKLLMYIRCYKGSGVDGWCCALIIYLCYGLVAVDNEPSAGNQSQNIALNDSHRTYSSVTILREEERYVL